MTTRKQEPIPAISIDSPEIDLLVRRHDGKIYLIAVNTSNRMINASVKLEDYTVDAGEIRLPFEMRTVKLTRGGFADVFTAYEPHVYEFFGTHNQ